MWVFALGTLHFLAVNKAAVEHYGYSEAEFLGMTIADIRDPADVPALMTAMEGLGHGERTRVTTRHRRKDGTLIEAEIAGDFMVFDGRPAQIVVVNDVTARVAAERMMRESEERFHLLSKATNDAIWDWDLLTDALWWNDGYYSLFGYTRSDAPNRVDTWRDGIVPGDRGRVVDGMQRAIADGAESWWDEYRFIRADGTHAYVLDRGYVIRDARGRAIRMIGGMTDLTSRREAEEQIAAQAALLNEAQDAILLMDLNHRVLFWNRGAEQLYGWSPGEAIGQIDTALQQVDSPAHREAHARLLETGRWEGTLEHRTRLGELLTVESRWALTRDALGQPKSILILSTDVTERKRNEAHHLRAQRMESIGTLAGGIAHDLNNLLAPMMMSVDLLRESCTDPDSLDLLRTVQVSAARGADLVQQVLSFARGVEGERVPVSPVMLVRELQKIIRDSFPKSVRVVVTLDDGLWSVLGDATQLHQVLLNLCINARDAMPDGGELSIGVANAEVDDVYAAHNPDARVGDYVVLRLSDTGTGISASLRERIFEPFFSTKEMGRGTGLGLSTSMAIVRSHGGFISLYSEPGSGTTFRVYLPANRAELAQEDVPRAVPVMARGHGELVLVVDDEAPIRRIAQRTLERFGYRVLTAANGVEAVAIYAERGSEIDLVLTDMAMPVMDGPALITALRGLDPHVRIIGSSGLASVDGVDAGHDGPRTRFVPKPYTAETMLRAVHDALVPDGTRRVP
jgi:PAS domain S-box-containing protein